MNIIWAVAGVLGWSAALYRDGDEDVDVHSRVVRRWRWLLCDAAVPGKKKIGGAAVRALTSGIARFAFSFVAVVFWPSALDREDARSHLC